MTEKSPNSSNRTVDMVEFCPMDSDIAALVSDKLRKILKATEENIAATVSEQASTISEQTFTIPEEPATILAKASTISEEKLSAVPDGQASTISEQSSTTISSQESTVSEQKSTTTISETSTIYGTSTISETSTPIIIEKESTISEKSSQDDNTEDSDPPAKRSKISDNQDEEQKAKDGQKIDSNNSKNNADTVVDPFDDDDDDFIFDTTISVEEQPPDDSSHSQQQSQNVDAQQLDKQTVTAFAAIEVDDGEETPPDDDDEESEKMDEGDVDVRKVAKVERDSESDDDDDAALEIDETANIDDENVDALEIDETVDYPSYVEKEISIGDNVVAQNLDHTYKFKFKNAGGPLHNQQPFECLREKEWSINKDVRSKDIVVPSKDNVVRSSDNIVRSNDNVVQSKGIVATSKDNIVNVTEEIDYEKYFEEKVYCFRKNDLRLTELKLAKINCEGIELKVPVFLVDAFNLIARNIKVEGLFLIRGSPQRIRLMRYAFFGEFGIPEYCTMFDVCDLILYFFANLRESLFTKRLELRFLLFLHSRNAAASGENIQNTCKLFGHGPNNNHHCSGCSPAVSNIYTLLKCLPCVHLDTLIFLIIHLKQIFANRFYNKVQSSDLFENVGPSIFRNYKVHSRLAVELLEFFMDRIRILMLKDKNFSLDAPKSIPRIPQNPQNLPRTPQNPQNLPRTQINNQNLKFMSARYFVLQPPGQQLGTQTCFIPIVPKPAVVVSQSENATAVASQSQSTSTGASQSQQAPVTAGADSPAGTKNRNAVPVYTLAKTGLTPTPSSGSVFYSLSNDHRYPNNQYLPPAFIRTVTVPTGKIRPQVAYPAYSKPVTVTAVAVTPKKPQPQPVSVSKDSADSAVLPPPPMTKKPQDTVPVVPPDPTVAIDRSKIEIRIDQDLNKKLEIDDFSNSKPDDDIVDAEQKKTKDIVDDESDKGAPPPHSQEIIDPEASARTDLIIGDIVDAVYNDTVASKARREALEASKKPKPRFTCRKCDRSYSTISQLYVHMKLHRSKNRFLLKKAVAEQCQQENAADADDADAEISQEEAAVDSDTDDPTLPQEETADSETEPESESFVEISSSAPAERFTVREESADTEQPDTDRPILIPARAIMVREKQQKSATVPVLPPKTATTPSSAFAAKPFVVPATVPAVKQPQEQSSVPSSSRSQLDVSRWSGRIRKPSRIFFDDDMDVY